MSDREKRLEAALRRAKTWLQGDDWRFCPDPEKARAWLEIMNQIEEALADDDAGGGEKHKWDRAGERCVKCGAKDWMDAPCHPPQHRDALENVPEAVRRLPDEFDYRARCVSDLSSALWKVAANRVREALAQHSEPGKDNE